jgi:hypothetical protein
MSAAEHVWKGGRVQAESPACFWALSTSLNTSVSASVAADAAAAAATSLPGRPPYHHSVPAVNPQWGSGHQPDSSQPLALVPIPHPLLLLLLLLLLLPQAFQGDPPTTVFLLSIRSGAVGINLTAANHVFLLEPCLNAALEEQAIGRAWRMGQGRKVMVKRFYVKVCCWGGGAPGWRGGEIVGGGGAV